MKRYRIYIALAIIALVLIVLYTFFGSPDAATETIEVQVKSGTFEIQVSTSGELEAKNSEKIMGPMNVRNYRIWNMKIEDIIPDGTVVDSGDYVATLDRSEITNKLKDRELDLESLHTQFTQTQLDTTMDLRAARDELVNLEYNLEERQITVDQSIYEPPATQRQAKIDLDKSKRAYDQAVENYQLKLEKARANMAEVNTKLRKAQNEYQEMIDLLDQFTIFAPKAGMVIYRRDWNGQKMGIGANVGAWDPIVAELPDLTEMKSRTYVNEIDISKVKVGQEVKIGVDAFPDKKYTGVVTEVANIGEQLRNSNAKVFEVIIEVNESDSILRPAMTTKNMIITDVIDSVLYVPIESIHSNDSLSYVYKDSRRQQVILGKANENEIIIRAGLEDGDDIYLVPPEGAEEYSIVPLDTAIVNHFRRLDEAKKGNDEEKQEMTPEELREMLMNMSQEERMKYIQEHPEVMQQLGGPGGKRPGGGRPGGGRK
ncbi:MAG: efflux RND transporter periplasmic adaptor subunit [Bacteroidales bacterium]|jgi:multidrug efflux pump subunit AcrA (membrane-fusion protein)|nr:efflux RND transporter periplasmic adaptor subunit [Bacteroidales bacterium]